MRSEESTRHRVLVPAALLAAFIAAAALCSAAPIVAQSAPTAAPNTLTRAERDAGWQLLFDGTSTSQWRGYKSDTMPGGWKVEVHTSLDISPQSLTQRPNPSPPRWRS